MTWGGRGMESDRDQRGERMKADSFHVRFARFPGGQSEHPAASQWIIDTSRAAGSDRRIRQVSHWWISDTPIPMLRNRCVREALEDGVDYLVMIDRDMAPDLPRPGSRPFWDSSWEWLMRRREEEDAGGEAVPPATVAAPYLGQPVDCYAYVWDWQPAPPAAGASGNGTWDTSAPEPGGVAWVHELGARMVMPAPEEAATRSGIVAAAALATGLILYDLRLFERLPPPWFAYEYGDRYETTKLCPEDVYQTRRAGLLGLPQMCNWDSWAGHVKLATVGPFDGTAPRTREGVVGGAPMGMNSARRDR
jgi:hypothetical protein